MGSDVLARLFAILRLAIRRHRLQLITKPWSESQLVKLNPGRMARRKHTVLEMGKLEITGAFWCSLVKQRCWKSHLF